MVDFDLTDYVSALGPNAEQALKEKFTDAWDKFSPGAKEAARQAVLDLVQLGLVKAAGKDVNDEMAFAKASIANVISLAADVAGETVKEALLQAAELVGQGLVAVLKGVAKGALA